MELNIAIKGTGRELKLEVDLTQEDLVKLIEEAEANNGVIKLTDDKDQTVLIPARSLGFIQIGSSEPRRVGFGLL